MGFSCGFQPSLGVHVNVGKGFWQLEVRTALRFKRTCQLRVCGIVKSPGDNRVSLVLILPGLLVMSCSVKKNNKKKTPRLPPAPSSLNGNIEPCCFLPAFLLY